MEEKPNETVEEQIETVEEHKEVTGEESIVTEPVVDKKKKNVVAIIALIFSIIGTGVVGLILSIIGLIKSKKINAGKGLSIASLIISILKILLCITFSILVVVFSFDFFEVEKESESKKTTIQKVENGLKVYACGSGIISYSFEEDRQSCVTYMTLETADNAKGIGYSEFDNAILYQDSEGVHEYFIFNKKTVDLDIEGYEKYEIVDADYDNQGIGLLAGNVIDDGDDYPYNETYSKMALYDFETNKTYKFDSKYESFYYVNNSQILLVDGKKFDIYNLSNMNKVYLSGSLPLNMDGDIYNYYGINLTEFTMNGKKLYKLSFGQEYDSIVHFYDSNKKLLYSGDYSGYKIDGESLTVINNNKAIKYSFDGTVIKEFKEYKNIHMILSADDVKDNYLLVNDDNNIFVVNLTDDTETVLSEWKDTYYIHTMISTYYAREMLENEPDKPVGFYIIIQYDKNDGGAENPAKGYEVCFAPDTLKVTRYELEDGIGGYAKPVLYLYPEKETKVTVTFENSDKLTTTYPKYNKAWTVTAKPNGDLYDENGKYYYGLYWEEEPNHDITFDEGFYVTKDNAIEFLETKTKEIGLSDREANEFIMYWLPILEKNGQSLVYFELTEERDNNSKINISPKPDAILRMAIHVKKVNKSVNIKEQKLTSFARKGFTVVEWGGVIH